MVVDLPESPSSVPSLVVFNEFNDLVVGDDFLVLVIDDALEFDNFRVAFRLGDVVVDNADDFGVVAAAVFVGWH